MIASYLVYFLIYLNEKYPNVSINIYAQGRNSIKMQTRFGVYFDRSYFHYVSCDISKEIKLNKRMQYIIHAASLASPQYYLTNPVDVIIPNTVGTNNLLKLAYKDEVEGLLFFSSSDIYGKLENKEKYTETDSGYLDPMSIRSCYAESKRVGESMCKAYSSQYGVPTKCVRISHTYGPTLDIYQDERLFAEFVKNVVDGEDIVMKSDGTATRCFCYITDAVLAFFNILEKGQSGEAYNMCNANGATSVKELANTLSNLFPERNVSVVFKERDEHSNYLESPVKQVPIFSTEKLQSLGWTPIVSIEEGFKRTVQSYLIKPVHPTLKAQGT